MGDKEARAAYEKMVQNMMNNYGEHTTGEYNTGRTLTAEEVLQNRYGRNADAANKPLLKKELRLTSVGLFFL